MPPLLPADPPTCWPDPPDQWSPSSLARVEACPRQWALQHATYGAFEEAGFPDRPSLASLKGSVIHAVLDQVVAALAEAGCWTVQSACGVMTMRRLGGLRHLVQQHIANALNALKDNPRAEAQYDRLARALDRESGSVLEVVVALLHRQTIAATLEQPDSSPASIPAATTTAPRFRSFPQDRALREGTHPEVWLSAPAVSLRGRADLITVEEEQAIIVDFKTGRPADHHADQLRLYGLIWLFDAEKNPGSLPAAVLRLDYPSGSIEVLVPESWESLREDVSARIDAARHAVIVSPPPARPAADLCAWCSVRALCDDYWEATTEGLRAEEAGPGNFVDAVVTLREPRGPGFWQAQVSAGTGLAVEAAVQVELRPGREGVVGQRLRLLGARWIEGEQDNAIPLLVEVGSTECFS